MTAQNDCDLVRVFTRLTAAGSTISDQTIKSNEPFQVVVQAEAGGTLHGGGGSYTLGYVVRDLTDGTTVSSANQSGSFGDANWPNPGALEFAFPNIAAQGAAKQNHLYQVLAFLTAGNVDPISEFAESDLLIITKP